MATRIGFFNFSESVEIFSGIMSGLCLAACMPNLKFEHLAILELLAFNTQKIGGHVTLTPPIFREYFSGVMSGLCLGSCVPSLKFASLAILELLAFNAQKIGGQVILTPPPFREFFSWVVSGLSLGACVPNLKFVLWPFWRNPLKIATVRSRTHNTKVCRTSDIGHGKWFYILYNAAMHSIRQTTTRDKTMRKRTRIRWKLNKMLSRTDYAIYIINKRTMCRTSLTVNSLVYNKRLIISCFRLFLALSLSCLKQIPHHMRQIIKSVTFNANFKFE